MPRHYLDVPFKEKDEAKALGARFDWSARLWYIGHESDLAPFAKWLPESLKHDLVTAPAAVASAEAQARVGAPLDAPRGIPLSQLLRRVAQVVAGVHEEGVWTVVEIVEARLRGHVYLEVSERNADGQPIAKARAMIWESTAARILPEFEQRTGMAIGAGLKVLVLLRPVFHVQYGFSLQIDAIDAHYSLGLLEAKRREIRARLQREGVYENNRRLPAPWDYYHVVVVAPLEAAGLGDFQQEAERLERLGICRFRYVYSRFQGEGAAREIVDALDAHLRASTDTSPDAVVLIRGGGAVSDLAWLDDYDLARYLCDLPIPVFTGIGHERDNTLPDEVAQLRFDTPSKVIAGIEQRIVQRVRDAVAAAETVFGQTQALLKHARTLSDERYVHVRTCAQEQVHRAREGSRDAFAVVGRHALRQIHDARTRSADLINQSQTRARVQVAVARQQTPALLRGIHRCCLAIIGDAGRKADLAHQALLSRSGALCRHAGHAVDIEQQRVRERAQGMIQTARSQAMALMREIVGQGPEKTLARGFVIVRSDAGVPVTRKAHAERQATLEIEFNDGRMTVRTSKASGK